MIIMIMAAGLLAVLLFFLTWNVVDSASMKKKKYRHFPLDNTDWDSILSTAPVLDFQSYETGYLKMSRADVLECSHPDLPADTPDFFDLKIYLHVISHPEHGDYLIDAGLDSSFQKQPFGTVRGLLAARFSKPMYQNPGQNTAALLKQHGIRPWGVLYTHLHSDHMAGTIELPKNLNFIAGKNDPYQNFRPLYYGDQLKGIKTLYLLDFSTATEMPFLGPVIDIFGDKSVLAFSSRGHTKGHVGYLLHSTSGWVLLTGDACYNHYAYDRGLAPGLIYDDKDAAAASLQRIRDFHAHYPAVRIIPGH